MATLQKKLKEEIKKVFRANIRMVRNTYSGVRLKDLQNILLSVAVDLAVVESHLTKRAADGDTMWCICPNPINENGMCGECGYPCYPRNKPA